VHIGSETPAPAFDARKVNELKQQRPPPYLLTEQSQSTPAHVSCTLAPGAASAVARAESLHRTLRYSAALALPLLRKIQKEGVYRSKHLLCASKDKVSGFGLVYLRHTQKRVYMAAVHLELLRTPEGFELLSAAALPHHARYLNVSVEAHKQWYIDLFCSGGSVCELQRCYKRVPNGQSSSNTTAAALAAAAAVAAAACTTAAATTAAAMRGNDDAAAASLQQAAQCGAAAGAQTGSRTAATASTAASTAADAASDVAAAPADVAAVCTKLQGVSELTQEALVKRLSKLNFNSFYD
jgi:hypothetical protein